MSKVHPSKSELGPLCRAVRRLFQGMGDVVELCQTTSACNSNVFLETYDLDGKIDASSRLDREGGGDERTTLRDVRDGANAKAIITSLEEYNCFSQRSKARVARSRYRSSGASAPSHLLSPSFGCELWCCCHG